MRKAIIEKNSILQCDHVYNLTYRLFECSKIIEDIGEIVTYGIAVQLIIDNAIMKKENTEIEDICFQKEKAIELFKKVVEYEVFPIHLNDVIMDSIS